MLWLVWTACVQTASIEYGNKPFDEEKIEKVSHGRAEHKENGGYPEKVTRLFKTVAVFKWKRWLHEAFRNDAKTTPQKARSN